ncbi:hypothetical protein [Rhizobium sp. 60-20]|uniref:hypothetical protein n=1 Tax=Rhizobium sp. 60-20 TaxID=1895819 RepID=UPI000928C475|nr:hypothetical protein [Rhizobium sp. 60-20]MBN8952366.1 hypothetical protein [Rhizobium tropici]OJY79699.1 MAG: hypothetical protein BGP09_07100 [Rhizobium sp. 60-20]
MERKASEKTPMASNMKPSESFRYGEKMESRIMSSRLLVEVDRLESLLGDLRRLEMGTLDVSDLGDGLPTLERCSVSARRTSCLEGIVFGHPKLPDGERIFTSQIYAFLKYDGQLFGRTENRWYRLKSIRDRAGRA